MHWVIKKILIIIISKTFPYSGRRLSVSTGILYGFGSDKKYEQDGNLDEPSERNFLQGNRTITKASYYSIGLLFGVTINFNKKS